MSNRKRALFLIIIAIFCAVGLTDAAWQTLAQKAGKNNADREKLAKKPAPSGTIQQRLDKDDGYALALFFSGDIHGNLEVCGCPIHPLGGVARRMGYINAFKKRSPDVPIVMVDAGRIFADDKRGDSTDLVADARLMNDWIVRANEVMNLEIVNLSYRDLLYAGDLLKPEAKLKPEKSVLLSANVKATDNLRENPAPYVIKTVTGKRLKAPVRIAFIGLSDLPPDGFKEQVTASGFVVNDPLEVAKKALAEVQDKADVTVVVGYLKRGTVNKLAQQNAELDLIINADGTGITLDPMQINNTLIMYATKETKHLGELRFYADAEGGIERFTVRYVELDEVIADDAALATMTKTARKEIDAVQTKMAEDEAALIAAKIAVDGMPPTSYVTSEKCAQCHQVEFDKWQKTRHSHAFKGLETRQRIYDAACVGCHSVGFDGKGQDKGFINIKATPQFANVHCESCHGPGAEHVAKPEKGKYTTPTAPASCVKCHDRDNSPDFVFEKYWPVVAHGNLKVTPAVKPATKPTVKAKKK